MEERLKQRLVGAVVLVSLAVIFVPILFDMPPEVDEESPAIQISEIPERPPDGFGTSASDELGAPQTPRLDSEVERERDRTSPPSTAADGVVAAATPADDPGSASTDSAAPAKVIVELELPGSGTRSEPAPAPAPASSDPAPAAGRQGEPSEPGRAAEAPATGGWSVQLGSFLKSENATALRKRLQARGYRAFVKSGSSAQGEVSRVFVGPVPDREQAKSSAAKLRREMALEGIVVPYPGG